MAIRNSETVRVVYICIEVKFVVQFVGNRTYLCVCVCVCNIKICHSLWNLTVYYCVCKSPPFVPVLKHINMLHAMPYHSVSLMYILILSFHLCLGLTNDVSYHNAACIFFTLPCISWLVFHTLLDVINQIIFEEEYKSWSFSLYSFLQSPVTFSLFGQNIVYSTLCFKINFHQQLIMLLWFSL
jgi:hypothetical protein